MAGEFSFGDFGDYGIPSSPSGGGLFGDGQVQYGPAFSGSLGADVAQAGGTLSQAGIPQGGGNWWTQFTGSNVGGAPMPGGGGGNWWNSLFGGGSGGGGLNDILGLVGKGAGIGSSILGGVAGIQNMNRGAQQQKIATGAERQLGQMGQQVSASALPLVSAGSSGLLTGQLNPELEAIVQKKKQEELARYRDYFARSGIADSTMMQSYEAQAEQNAQILRSQLASQLYSSGLQGVQGAYAPTAVSGEIAAMAMGGSAQQASQLQNSIYKILNS
jgi:hypothetical protein